MFQSFLQGGSEMYLNTHNESLLNDRIIKNRIHAMLVFTCQNFPIEFISIILKYGQLLRYSRNILTDYCAWLVAKYWRCHKMCNITIGTVRQVTFARYPTKCYTFDIDVLKKQTNKFHPKVHRTDCSNIT